MISYKFTDNVRRTITVSLESASPHQRAKIIIAGDESLKAIVSDELSRSYGAFGHSIGDTTSPIDLDAALKSPAFKEFDVQLLEGAELVSSYSVDIPEGSVT